MQNSRTINNAQVSIIIPTYNESKNILQILKSIGEHLPKNLLAEAIVVDDNSPDGTGKIVEDYLKEVKQKIGYIIHIIHRKTKSGLSSAVLRGIEYATGDTIVVIPSNYFYDRISKYNMFVAGWDDNDSIYVTANDDGSKTALTPHKLFYQGLFSNP